MFPLLIKPTGDFEGVGECGKFFFILGLGIDGLLHSGGVVLIRGEFNSTDCQTTLSLGSHIQKVDSIDSLLTIFKGFFVKTFLKARFCKQPALVSLYNAFL